MDKRIVLFLTLVLTFFSVASSSAQHDNSKAVLHKMDPLSVKAPTDTLQPASFSTGTPALYGFTEGGYCFGNSPLHDRAFAQKYLVPQSYWIYGVALYIGAKQVIGSPDTLAVNFYRLEGPGIDTSGAVGNAPDTVFHSVMITTSLIDTSGLTFVMFPDSFVAFVDYAMGIDISEMNDDTIGLVTTTNGDAMHSQLSWEKYANGTWHTVLEPTNWGMDLDFGIFVITDMSTATIGDDYFMDGIKLSQNQPNPASSATLIEYEIETGGPVAFEIYDANGRKVFETDEGIQTKGKHEMIMNTSGFNKGIYFYSLRCGSHRIIKKMIIE